MVEQTGVASSFTSFIILTDGIDKLCHRRESRLFIFRGGSCYWWGTCQDGSGGRLAETNELINSGARLQSSAERERRRWVAWGRM